MNTSEISALSGVISRTVRDYVSQALAGVSHRIDELSETVRSIPRPEKGDRGEPGPQGERGLTGERGADGASGAPGPKGERGIQGERGLTGERGADGINGRDAEPIHPDTIELMVRRAVEAVPPPRDGKDGIPGKDADAETVRSIIALELEKARLADPVKVGIGPPSITGRSGDIYIDRKTGDEYRWSDETERPVVNVMVQPAPITVVPQPSKKRVKRDERGRIVEVVSE